ncbi:MAG: hypothetical protein KJ072_00095 [Verrucomicrobia bacterium]|nr:hypothetical protein [Verrucomicrobiota bacterium]
MSLNSSSKAWPASFAVLVLALIAQSALLYPRLKVKDAEIAALKETAQARDQSDSTRDAPARLAAQSEELARLRKDNQELHRLRNEVRQLREATQQAAKPAPATPLAAPAPDLLNQLQRQVQQLQAENNQLRADQQQVLQVQAQAQAHVALCLNNLRHLDGAKQQWALETRQPAEALPEPADLEPYLPDPARWTCPAGGVYTLNAVGMPPTCSVPGHALP